MLEAATPSASSTSLPLWLGLILTPNLGQRGAQHLLQQFHTPEAIYAASLTELEACRIKPDAAQHLHDGRSAALGAAEAEKAAALGLSIITQGDRAYPELLREIFDPPLLLYVQGRIEALDQFAVAVVGTRHPTVYGRLMAERMGHDLAAWGLTVLSGLARGIDAIGQKACVEADGTTVGVLGTGLDIIYPSENRGLAESILKNGGALVSEFPLGTFPAAQNFPIRNRVISGMALGVLVIEGGEYSGSRITARMALEQNRDVYAVPGMATQKQAWLPNMLIKQGGKLVTEVTDIIDELPSAVRARLQPPPPPPVLPTANGQLDSSATLTPAGQQAVLNALRTDEVSHVDEVIERLQDKWAAPEVLTLLFELELGGQIRQFPGKKYLRVS